jgi:Fe-S cluster biogenesis protein NfuA
MDQTFLDVYAEQTPNPETMKFVFNRDILPNEALDFPTKDKAITSPLAKNLFEFSFVNGVFIMNNFVTVTRVPGHEWEDIIPITREFLKSYIAAGEKVVIETFERENLESEDPIISKIQEILETYIKPAVEVDGGQIIFKSFDEGKVTVELQGSCSGCPSSTITLKRGIEGMLTRMVPEVKEVVAL